MWFSVNKKTLTSIKAFPLKDTLSEKYNREVNVMNDATAAAFGEYIAGNAKGYKRVGYITISTGIGGGFVFDGMPLLSESGLVSHIGFTTSRFAKDKCGSGRMQTVESIASGRAIEHIANNAGHKNINAKQIYKEFLSGQPWAEKIIKQSAAVIAELCGNIKATLDVDIILLGGSIGLADGYLSLVKKYLLEEPEVFMPQLNHSLLGVNASKIGVLYQGDT
jgi:N-acylmannosamine kinase